jgi:hypothetical protein
MKQSVTHSGEKKFVSENLKEKDHLEDLSMEGRLTF